MGNKIRALMILQNTNPTRWGKSHGFTPNQMTRVLNKGWGLGNPHSISWKIVETLKADGFWPADEEQERKAA